MPPSGHSIGGMAAEPGPVAAKRRDFALGDDRPRTTRRGRSAKRWNGTSGVTGNKQTGRQGPVRDVGIGEAEDLLTAGYELRPKI